MPLPLLLPAVPKEYFFTLNQASTDMNSTSSSSNALLQPASTLNTTFAEALHAALRLPAAYPVSSIHVWLEDATQPAQQRRLQEAAPLQEQQQQQAIVLAVWGFQLWPSRSLPRAEVLASDVVTGEDAGMSVVLQLIAAGAIDPRAMAQLQGSISTSREDAFAAQVDNAEGALALRRFLLACARLTHGTLRISCEVLLMYPWLWRGFEVAITLFVCPLAFDATFNCRHCPLLLPLLMLLCCTCLQEVARCMLMIWHLRCCSTPQSRCHQAHVPAGSAGTRSG
jgi:hypothetical protein